MTQYILYTMIITILPTVVVFEVMQNFYHQQSIVLFKLSFDPRSLGHEASRLACGFLTMAD